MVASTKRKARVEDPSEADGEERGSGRQRNGGGDAKGKRGPIGFGDALKGALTRKVSTKTATPIAAATSRNTELDERAGQAKAEKQAAKLVVAKQKWFEKDHKLPEAGQANHEKMLLKLATRGIVKLFNAVQAQQKKRREELKPSDVQAPAADKMTKGEFLDMIKGGGSQTAAPITAGDEDKVKDEESEVDSGSDGEDAASKDGSESDEDDSGKDAGNSDDQSGQFSGEASGEEDESDGEVEEDEGDEDEEEDEDEDEEEGEMEDD